MEDNSPWQNYIRITEVMEVTSHLSEPVMEPVMELLKATSQDLCPLITSIEMELNKPQKW